MQPTKRLTSPCVKKVLFTDSQGRKIVFAPCNKIEKYAKGIQPILNLIGHPEAFVSSLSTVYDFDINDKRMEKLKKIMKSAKQTTFIWQLAQNYLKINKKD